MSGHHHHNNVKVSGAGIMPFMVSSKGELLFLLGREKYQAGYRGSSRWSAFEGGAHATETVLGAAVREFTEESIGCLSCAESELSEQLQNKDYNMSVTIRTQYHGGSIHVTFVKQFSYTPHVAEIFARRRHWLVTAQKLHSIAKILGELVPHAYPYLQCGDVVCRSGEFGVVDDVRDVEYLDDVLHLTAIVRTAERDGGGGGGGGTRRVRLSHTHLQPRLARLYVRLFLARRRLAQHIDEVAAMGIPDGALSVKRSPLGTLRNVTVNVDFLEKSTVRLWSLPELKAALQDRAYNSEAFRPYFLFVMNKVVQEFSCAS